MNHLSRNRPAEKSETARAVAVRFHALSAGGDAVGRDSDERTVFAPLAAPDEEAQVEIIETKKRFARGRVLQITRPSAHRVAPPCPYFQREISNAEAQIATNETPDSLDETAKNETSQPQNRSETGRAPQAECGGCQWQHIEYSMQVAAKRDLVVQALRRIGGVEDAETLVENCLVSPPFSYRNKADFVVTAETFRAPKATRDASQNTKNQDAQSLARIGFYARDSHRVVDVARCLIQQEPNNLVLQAVREACEIGLAAPFDARDESGVLQRVVVRTSTQNESFLVVVTTRADWPQADAFARFVQERAPQIVGVLRRTARDATVSICGRDWLEETVDGLRLRVTGDGFFQVNSPMTPQLLQTALRLAEVRAGERVLDAFCGVGLFALALARKGARVLGIEQNAQAIENAIFNARQNGLEAEFTSGDVAQVLRQRARNRRGVEKFDVVLLDPPRAGAASCLSEIAHLAPRRIVYVSCDAATLARDVRALALLGYVLKRAIPLDFFPQTAHVETVARLERVN